MSDKDRDLNQLVTELRQFVNDQLRKDLAPKDLSYGLAYVATELGLHFTDDSTTVFPVVLRAVSQAVDARHAADEEASEDNEEITEEVSAPDNAVLH